MNPVNNHKNEESQSVMQQESPRTCKVCGGPNHHGCGCEAKQRRSVGMVEDKDLKTAEQPKSEEDALEEILSPEAMIEASGAMMKSHKDIARMADGFEGLCACMYDTNNYLKVITGDCITIRKFLSKEDDKLIESGDFTGNILSYLSNIEQQLKEINARGQNAGENKN